jgi:ABC-type nitrate/sulfonate/bicarbonate transport system permease component
MLFPIRRGLSPRTDFALGLAGIGTLFLVWCGVTYGGYVGPLFLPTPTGIWNAIGDFHRHHWIFPAIWGSFWRVTRALGLVILVGVPVGVAMGTFAPVDAFLRRIISGAKSVPTTGILGLIVLWFSLEERAKILFLFLGAIFYMVIMVKNAVLNVREDYIRVALDIGANRWQMVSRVLIPGALPQIWDAIAVCNGIMWTYIVLAEFINSNEAHLGLGYLLYIGSRTQESSRVFAALILIAVISSLTDWVLYAIRKRFWNW